MADSVCFGSAPIDRLRDSRLFPDSCWASWSIRPDIRDFSIWLVKEARWPPEGRPLRNLRDRGGTWEVTIWSRGRTGSLWWYATGSPSRSGSPGEGPALLMLHGFLGSSEAWGSELLSRLAAVRRIVAVDLIGHGASSKPHSESRYAQSLQTADVTDVLDALGYDRADMLGYSMGARLALAVAAACPDRVGQLILESGSPGLESGPPQGQTTGGG